MLWLDAELRSVQDSEELMVNVAAALNNLSFYQAESAVLRDSQLAIAQCKTRKGACSLCGCVFCSH